ncbi:MAG: hypothetical protein H6Q89_4640 [Myxococcaceae bacterium]|nr:hypothetical protein [Myxococcaceae bacterium]
MGWDAVVFGELKVPAANAESWLTTEVAPSDFKGWPDFFDADFKPRTPEVLLEELKESALEPHEFLDLTLAPGGLTVRGMMAKDPLLDARMPLAVLWRSAAQHGGRGELIFFGYQTIAFGYRVKLEKGKSVVKLLTKAEQKAIEKSKPYQQLDARAHAALDALLGGKAKGKAGKGVNPFTGRPATTSSRSRSSRPFAGR